RPTGPGRSFARRSPTWRSPPPGRSCGANSTRPPSRDLSRRPWRRPASRPRPTT
ncbi:MAG: ATP synthase F0 sector subunit b, partial [uncultured Thermomicrobiales bacterium]